MLFCFTLKPTLHRFILDMRNNSWQQRQSKRQLVGTKREITKSRMNNEQQHVQNKRQVS